MRAKTLLTHLEHVKWREALSIDLSSLKPNYNLLGINVVFAVLVDKIFDNVHVLLQINPYVAYSCPLYFLRYSYVGL